MTKQLRLNIVLTSQKLYISGEELEGILKVYVINDTTINHIKIGMIGKISIEADENGSGKNPTTIEEKFHCNQEIKFGASDLNEMGGEEAKIIPFGLPLDSNLPPTVVVREGSIKYYLYATMEEQFIDGTTQVVNTQTAISVTSLVDCNSNSMPKREKEKVVKNEPVQSCLCFVGQAHTDIIRIKPRVYVPGDYIKINAVVYKTSNHAVSFVKAVLIQKVKLMLDNRTVKSWRVVTDRMRACVRPGQPQVWENEYLRIPPLPPTWCSKHIEVSYKLKLMTIKQNAADGDSPKPLLSMPVFIGNLPLESSLDFFNPITEGLLLPIPEEFKEYAKVESCILGVEGSKFVPSYITYMTEREMENIELLF